jgi:hypothetical protein
MSEAPAASMLDSTEAAPDSTVPVQWVTIARQSKADVAVNPTPLRASSDSLRVITTLGAGESPYSPGLVLTNVLSNPLTPPVASVRGVPRFTDRESVDTTVVGVPKGQLYLFIPQHYGVKDWSVVVQEQRRGG